jgi:hypothetical protein
MKRKASWKKITREPYVYYIAPMTTKRGATLWKLLAKNGKTLGIYNEEREAKEAGIARARKYLVVPKEWREKYKQQDEALRRLKLGLSS